MTKIIILNICLILLSGKLLSNNIEPNNPYYMGLKAHIEFFKTKGFLENTAMIYIEGNSEIRNSLPPIIDGYNIVVYSNSQIEEKAIEKKEFYLISFRARNLTRSGLSLYISNYSVKYKRKKLNFILLSSSNLVFEYDCSLEHFVIKHREH